MHFRASNCPMSPARAYRLGIILVTLSALVWSTAGLFTRLISVDTPTMLLWRGCSGRWGFLPICCLRRARAAGAGGKNIAEAKILPLQINDLSFFQRKKRPFYPRPSHPGYILPACLAGTRLMTD
jgi:hypothetical protein